MKFEVGLLGMTNNYGFLMGDSLQPRGTFNISIAIK
jgi:hypothetical protein